MVKIIKIESLANINNYYIFEWHNSNLIAQLKFWKDTFFRKFIVRKQHDRISSHISNGAQHTHPEIISDKIII